MGLGKGEPGVHVPTVLAIGVLAYVVTTLVHEAAGHGLMCLALGGDALAVSSTELRCAGLAEDRALMVTAAGTPMNVLVGLATMLFAARAPVSGTTRYFLWVFGALNLFHAGSYLLIGPFLGFGDWGAIARSQQPVVAWQIGLTAIGYGLIVLARRLAAQPGWHPLLGAEPQERERRFRHLTRLPFVAALVASVAAGFLSPLRPEFALLTSVVAPCSFLWLIGLPRWSPAPDGSVAEPIGPSVPWIAAGSLAAVLFVVVFGPGLGSFAGHGIER